MESMGNSLEEEVVNNPMDSLVQPICDENRPVIVDDNGNEVVIIADSGQHFILQKEGSHTNATTLFEADSTVDDISSDKGIEGTIQTYSAEQELTLTYSQLPLNIENETGHPISSAKANKEEGKVNVRSRKRERKQTYQPRIEEHSDFEFIEVRIPVRAPSAEKERLSIRCPMSRSSNNEHKTLLKQRGSDNKENWSPKTRKNSECVGMLQETSRQMLNAANWIMQEANRFSSDSSSEDDADLDEFQAMKCEPKEYQETDLATALGIDPCNRSQEKIESRKLSIRQKMRTNKTVRFSLEEEFDIHERAEEYVSQLVPDCNYYRVPSPCMWEKEDIFSRNGSESEDPLSPERKRKRKSYDNIKCYVTHQNYSSRSYLASGQDNSKLLPEGTRLLKPPNKLVELVAQVINDSPDGMLQVQQVYLALQNRFPYFRYMDKSSITSWRSSIRHALYQKWFRKVSFSTDLISCRGCYWSINRRHTPKEWTMPSRHDPYLSRINIHEHTDAARNIEKEIMQYADPETAAAVECILSDLPPACLKTEEDTADSDDEPIPVNLFRIFTDDNHLADLEDVEDKSVLPSVDTLLNKIDDQQMPIDYRVQKKKEELVGSPMRDSDPLLTPAILSQHSTAEPSPSKSTFEHSAFMDAYPVNRSGFPNGLEWHHKSGDETAYNSSWNMAWEDYHNSLIAYQQPVLPAIYMPYVQCVDYTDHSSHHSYQPVYGKHIDDHW